jgi:three-Cys-motif partner protein
MKSGTGLRSNLTSSGTTQAYSTILTAQDRPRFHHVYIDAFAGAGVHLSKTTGERVEGSPVIAANTQPPFKEYHFIDLDGLKVGNLRRIFGRRPDVHVHHGDCNQIMLKEVLPRMRFEDFRRGLCLLDPYGLHLNWEVICTAGTMGTIDMFLNFPIADMNRNVFWRNADGVDEADIARMNAFWGDESWRNVAYEAVPTCSVRKWRKPTTRRSRRPSGSGCEGWPSSAV